MRASTMGTVTSPRVTVTVRSAPDGARTRRRTSVPSLPRMASRLFSGPLRDTGTPATATMASPAAMPARAAGLPG